MEKGHLKGHNHHKVGRCVAWPAPEMGQLITKEDERLTAETNVMVGEDGWFLPVALNMDVNNAHGSLHIILLEVGEKLSREDSHTGSREGS